MLKRSRGGIKKFCINGHDLSETRFNHAGSYRCKTCYYSQNRERRYQTRYGMSVSEFDALKEKQKGLCAICLKEPDTTHRNKYHVDHNHATGKVREILCARCNQGLGYFKEDIEVLKSAIAYLEKHNG